jgi:hypothetical protein
MSQTPIFRWRTRLRFVAFLALSAMSFVAQAQFPSRLNITLVGSHEPPQASSGFGDVWGEGNLACLGVWTAYSTFGFGIYNIANPASPQLLTVYNYSATAANRFEQGVIRSNILYVGSWGGSGNGSGLHIFSITNPSAPVLLSRITASAVGTVVNGFNDVHTLFLERNFLYEAAHNVGIISVKVFDVSNPAAPLYVRDIVTTNTTKVHQMTVRNKGNQVILYTSGWGGNDNGAPNSPGQTDIWDVTQIGSQPAQWLGRIYAGYNSHSSWPTDDGNTLIVCREMPGGDVKLYDITNPGSIMSNTPPLVTITPASMGLENDIPHNPVVVSNLLFLSWYQNGLQVFDITDRTKPVRVGFYDTYPGARSSSYQGNWGIYPWLGLNKVLLSDIQGGLFIVDASATAVPTNNYPPLMVQSPASLTTTQGMNATFMPTITGSLLQYRWTFNGATLAGTTSNSLTLTNVQSSSAGNYSVIASNASGIATSAVAVLSVVVPSGAPGISSQPQNISVYPDTEASFSVGVTGAAPLSYQWRFNGGDIAGATSSSFTLPAVEAEMVGYYSVVVSNAFGTATSSNAALILLDSPYISGVAAAPGSHSALVSWNTTVPSDSQVQFDPATVVIQNPSSQAAAAQGSFSSSSYIDPALTTNHVILLTGLAPDSRYSFQVLSTADTNTYVSGVYQLTTAGTNILDNPTATFTGSWTPGTSSVDKYQTNYAFASTVSGSATATATWRPNINTPGKYDVYVWYPQGSNRATNAPYLVSYNGGSTNVLVNQQTGGGAWRLIAAGIEFAKGTIGFVRLSNNAGPSVVIADAVRFVYVESQDFPTGQTVPTWWQKFFFDTAIDPTSDPDGDGYTTAQEYVMGTFPADPSSHLQLAADVGSAPGISFWPLLGDRNYQLLSRADIGGATWQPVPAGSITPTPDGHGVLILSVTNAPQNFYRLKVQMTTNSSFSGGLAVPAGRSFSPFASEAFCGPNRAYVR